jgi:phage head maturation protease
MEYSCMDIVAFSGDAIKSDKLGFVSGYLVRFGSPDVADLEGDYFTKSTDYGFPLDQDVPINLYWNHGMDKAVGKRCIGTGHAKADNIGIWYQAQIDMADDYAIGIARMAKAGKLGFSSGAASHMVERKSMGKANEIIRWTIAEASVTPTPAEYRNVVKSIKDMDYMDNMHMEMEMEMVSPVDQTPEEYAREVYAEVESDLVHEGMESIYEALCSGIYGVMELSSQDKLPYLMTLVDSFAVTAKDFIGSVVKSGGETKAIFSTPDTLRTTERRIRDVFGLSRTTAKRLAPSFYKLLRDGEVEEADSSKVKSCIVDQDVLLRENLRLQVELKNYDY